MALDSTRERCRICLEDTESHVPLHRKVPIDEDKIFISEILEYCVNIEVLLDDGKPQNACFACTENAKVAYKFKLMCVQSETTLNTEISTKIINQGDPLELKKEDDLIEFCDVEIINIKAEEPNLNNGEESNDGFDNNDDSEQEESSNYNDAEKTNKKICPQCGKSFKYNSEMQRHCRSHNKKCPYCDFTALDNNQLGMHMCKNHDDQKTLKCHNCDKRFFQKQNLKSHMLSHTGVKKHACEVCGKSFVWQCNLNVHLKWHKGEKPYKCDKCSNAYARHSELRKHNITHTHEDKDEGRKDTEKCPYCDFKGRGLELGMHMHKAHNDRKTIKCPNCEKCFFHQKNLKVHVLTHTVDRRYVCEVCSKGFSTVKKLNDHRKSHTGVKPYKCDKCGIAYARHTSLKNHLTKKHRNKVKGEENHISG